MIKNIPTNDPNRHLHDLICGIADYLIKESAVSPNDPNLYALISHWLEDHSFNVANYSTTTPGALRVALKSTEASLGLKRTPLLDNIPFTANKNSKFKFIDLFAGIGGFRQAFQELDGKCVFSSEWEKSAQQTYFRNYGVAPFGDINHFTDKDPISGVERSDIDIDRLIPDHDVLAAGFPCQPFSKAGVSARESLGKAHGFECETQGTLFHSLARIAYVKQPKFLFLENVRNIVGHDEGRTFEKIEQTIDEIGYKLYPGLIDSSSMVPQRRLRCYMICVQKKIVEQHGKFKFPDFNGDPLPLSSIVEDDPDPAYTISDKLWEGHKRRTKRNVDRGAGFTAKESDLSRPSNTIVSRYYKDGKECLIPQVGKNPRLLTIEECVKLFGYNRSETPFLHALSRTAAYRQFGNSVVVPVIHKIASEAVSQYIPTHSATKKKVKTSVKKKAA